MAFSITYNGERATMGVYIDAYGNLYIDQIQGPYNSGVSLSIQCVCESYIEEYKHVFIDIIKHKSKRRFRPLQIEEPQHVGFDCNNFDEIELP